MPIVQIGTIRLRSRRSASASSEFLEETGEPFLLLRLDRGGIAVKP